MRSALAVGLAARLGLLLASSALMERPELVTPLTAVMPLREALFFSARPVGDTRAPADNSPYQTDHFHQPPLVLLLARPLDRAARALGAVPSWAGDPFLLLVGLSMVACDLGLALCMRRLCRLHLDRIDPGGAGWVEGSLGRIPRSRKTTRLAARLDMGAHRAGCMDSGRLPDTVAAVCLLHPYSILACAALSTGPLARLCPAAALMFATEGSPFCAAAALALATHLVPHAVVVLPALVLLLDRERCAAAGGAEAALARARLRGTPAVRLLKRQQCGLDCGSGTVRVGAAFCLVWAALSIALFAACAQALGTWDFLHGCYLWQFTMSDFRPNLGIFWYLFVGMFDRFWNYFLFILQMHPFLYAMPAAIFFRHRPQFAATLALGTAWLFRPFCAAGDAGFVVSLLFLHPSSVSRVRKPVVLAVWMLFHSIMLPLMWHLWHYPQSGNANFFYFQALGWLTAHVMLLVECVRTMVLVDKGLRLSYKAHGSPMKTVRKEA